LGQNFVTVLKLTKSAHQTEQDNYLSRGFPMKLIIIICTH